MYVEPDQETEGDFNKENTKVAAYALDYLLGDQRRSHADQARDIRKLRDELEQYLPKGRLEHVDLDAVANHFKGVKPDIKETLPSAIILDVGHNPDAAVTTI